LGINYESLRRMGGAVRIAAGGKEGRSVLVDGAIWISTEATKHVGEVHHGIDGRPLAAGSECVERRDALPGRFCTHAHVVLAPEGDDSTLAFREVVRDGDLGVDRKSVNSFQLLSAYPIAAAARPRP
jgi:hypothetical protein